MNDSLPCVSICTIVKNRVYSIRRCIESVLNQDYPNIEYVIQDGASTDGTFEILREYERLYPDKIHLVSIQDNRGEEGYFRCLRRCRGEIIGICLSDDELLPFAASWAVKNMALYPRAAAIYGGIYYSDIDGHIIGRDSHPPSFNIDDYICHKFNIPNAAAFFRRECLHKIGLMQENWRMDVGDFEIWTRLGMDYPIKSISEIVAKYNIDPVSASSKPDTYLEIIKPTKQLMEEIFSNPCTPSQIRVLEQRAYAGLHLWVGFSLLNTNKKNLVWKQIIQSLHYKPEFRFLSLVTLHALYKTIIPRDQFFRSMYRKLKSKKILLQNS